MIGWQPLFWNANGSWNFELWYVDLVNASYLWVTPLWLYEGSFILHFQFFFLLNRLLLIQAIFTTQSRLPLRYSFSVCRSLRSCGRSSWRLVSPSMLQCQIFVRFLRRRTGWFIFVSHLLIYYRRHIQVRAQEIDLIISSLKIVLYLLSPRSREIPRITINPPCLLPLWWNLKIIVLLVSGVSFLIFIMNVDLLNTSPVRTFEAVIYQAIASLVTSQSFSLHPLRRMLISLRHGGSLMQRR